MGGEPPPVARQRSAGRREAEAGPFDARGAAAAAVAGDKADPARVKRVKSMRPGRQGMDRGRARERANGDGGAKPQACRWGRTSSANSMPAGTEALLFPRVAAVRRRAGPRRSEEQLPAVGQREVSPVRPVRCRSWRDSRRRRSRCRRAASSCRRRAAAACSACLPRSSTPSTLPSKSLTSMMDPGVRVDPLDPGDGAAQGDRLRPRRIPPRTHDAPGSAWPSHHAAATLAAMTTARFVSHCFASSTRAPLRMPSMP